MSSNRVIATKALSLMKVNGKQVSLEVATRTTLWQRPEIAIAGSVDGFHEAVERGASRIPEGTAKIVMRSGFVNRIRLLHSAHQTCRESNHISPKDQVDHFTAVCQDKDGKYIATLHFYKEEPSSK